MAKLQVHIYLSELQTKKHELKGSRQQAKYQSLDDTIPTSSPEKTSAVALGSQYKNNGTFTRSTSTKNNHKKVTFICLVRNSRHSAQKRRFKLSCLNILNFFCLRLLTFFSICTLEVSFEHYMTLTNCTSMKICCRKCLWVPFYLCTVVASCQAPKLLDNSQLESLNGLKL